MPLITIEMDVPLEDIDLSQCGITRSPSSGEFWGATYRNGYEYSWDIDDATYDGKTVFIEERSPAYDSLIDRLIEERFGNG